MSDVKNSKRKKSRLEAQHMAYAIRKRITAELMASFALSQKRIEAYVESATKGIADISEREVTAKLLRELTMDRNVWFITKERDTVLDLCQGISRQLRMGNTVFPEYYSEFIPEMRKRNDAPIKYIPGDMSTVINIFKKNCPEEYIDFTQGIISRRDTEKDKLKNNKEMLLSTMKRELDDLIAQSV